MKIVLNGENILLPVGCSLEGLLLKYQLEPSITIAEVNSAIVAKENYFSVFLKEGDSVELIRFMGGGE